MGLVINILISFIGLTVIVIAFYNYLPYIEKLLAEKLKISLFRNSKDHGVLGQIFYKYNHKDSQAWVEWVKSQDGSVQDAAIDKLIEHIDNLPSTWGSVTPEAIKGLAQFERREHVTIMKSVLKACKKFWKKYKVSEGCYEAALIGIVFINPDTAKSFLKEEIEEIEEEAQAMAIANTLKEFPEEEDINPLFTKLLTNQNLSSKARNYAINVAQKRNEEEAHLAFIETVEEMLESAKPLNEDDIKIFESLMNMVTNNVDEEAFTMLLKACTHEDLCKTSIRSMELILKSNFDEFSTEQLYSLINVKSDELGTIANTIADIHKLTPEEKQLCRYFNFDDQHPFKKSPVEVETKVTPLEFPPCLEKKHDELMDMVKKRSLDKQNGSGGGILISGYSDNEKLCLVRVAASERKWHFIYTAVEDALASSSTAKAMLDAINAHKPCVLYLDGVDTLIRNVENPFVKQLRSVANDPLVNLIGALKDDVDITDEGLCVLFTQMPEMQSIFPITLEIGRMDEGERKTILNEKVGKLSPENNAAIEQFNVLKPTDGMTAFEFDKYLTKYFRASILVSKKLIDYTEFERLDSVNFEGRGVL